MNTGIYCYPFKSKLSKEEANTFISEFSFTGLYEDFLSHVDKIKYYDLKDYEIIETPYGHLELVVKEEKYLFHNEGLLSYTLMCLLDTSSICYLSIFNKNIWPSMYQITDIAVTLMIPQLKNIMFTNNSF